MSHPRHLKRTRLAVMVLAAVAAQQAAAITTYAGDPGMLGDPASWRTAEFNRDWGLLAIGAEFAYARGFSGAGIKVGEVDSGYLDTHRELSSSRYTGVLVNGIAGAYNPAYNDGHGTHVAGTIGASRDGANVTNNMHGVAFNASVFVGNTGKTDGVLYGIPQATQTAAQTIDQKHVADVYRAVNAQGVRIISTSFGSQPNSEQYETLMPSTAIAGNGQNLSGRAGLLGAWGYLANEDTWFQGTLDAARTGTVIVFSAGNGGYKNPSPRASAAYFDPTLEANWLGVAAIRQTVNLNGQAVGQTLNADGSVNVPGVQLYNQCGVAKWSCVTAPGQAIYSSVVSGAYGSSSGTSMAAPHASGALAVVMERFGYMSNEQALTVLKTTAVQNATISNANGAAIVNPNAGKMVEVPDERNGWGTISLKNAMNGPGQFTGRFAVNTQGQNDTWSNNISDVAIKARKIEDDAEAASWNATKAAKGWTNGLPAGASADERNEYTVGMARETARSTREYEGSLAKFGQGTLVLSGDNSFSGGVELHGGQLVGASATAFGSGHVNVFGGTLGVRSADTLLVGGNLTLGTAGTLDLELGSGFTLGSGPLLQVGRRATLVGDLSLSFDSGFSFAAGTYTLLNAATLEGSFGQVSYTGLMAGYTANVLYTAGGVQLNIAAVPEPETYALLLGGLAVVGFVARRRRQG